MMSPHLPKSARTGRPVADDRKTVNGILFVKIIGCRWTEMPEKYGSKSTAHRRLQNWQQRRIWKKILSAATGQQAATAKGISRLVISSGQKRRSIIGYNGLFNRISGTKIHVTAEQNGLPIYVVIGPASSHDSTRFTDVMDDGVSEYLDGGTPGRLRSVMQTGAMMQSS